MDNKVSYIIDIKDDGTPALRKLGGEMESTNRQARSLKDSLSTLGMASLGISAVASAFSKLWSVMEAGDAAYKAQATAEQKLEQVMQSTMSATADDIQHIKDLTAAQQALGVVGDEVQISGMQQLAMFSKEKTTLDMLLPAMNDLLVQQHGLNATQQDAVGVADMLGKALNGQTMALRRAGIVLTEEQEAMLKTGTETERAAVLSGILADKVGGMNEAMAQTPSGQMQQYSNAMGDVSERLGALYNRVMTAMLPSLNKLVAALNVGLDVLNKAFTFVSENLDVLAAFAAGITALTVAANAHAIAATVATTATTVWTAAQTILNAVLTANPIGLVIAAIAALVGSILWVSKHTEGWGTLWDAVLTFMKEGFLAWVSAIQLEFDTVVNGLMMGLDKIKKGWYQFKEAVGLGDSAENKRAIEQINADVEKRQKAIAEGARKLMEHVNNARGAFDNVSIKWKEGGEASDDPSKAAKAHANALGGLQGGMGDTGLKSSAKTSADAIAGGGSRNTQITINFSKEMVKMDFNGGYMDNKQEVEDTLAQSLLRVLSAAKASI